MMESPLPYEILVHIFSYYVETESVQNLIDTVGNVCKQWNAAIYDPTLFRCIDEHVTKKTLLELIRGGRLLLTEYVDLSRLGAKLSTDDLREIITSVPRLKRLDLTRCSKGRKAFEMLSESCPDLREIHFSTDTDTHFQFPTTSFTKYLKTSGSKIHVLNLSANIVSGLKSVCVTISKVCENLQELYLVDMQAHGNFPLHEMQLGCPKLRVLQLSSPIYFSYTNKIVSKGFPALEVFSYINNSSYGFSDMDLLQALASSTCLSKLDVRGCKVTSQGLCKLEVDNLEHLYLSKTPICHSSDFSNMIKKWQHSLLFLDLSYCLGDYINDGIRELVSDTESKLKTLNLRSTNLLISAVKYVLPHLKSLSELNLQGCRDIDRPKRRVYRRNEISNLSNELYSLDLPDESNIPRKRSYYCSNIRYPLFQEIL